MEYHIFMHFMMKHLRLNFRIEIQPSNCFFVFYKKYYAVIITPGIIDFFIQNGQSQFYWPEYVRFLLFFESIQQ